MKTHKDIERTEQYRREASACAAAAVHAPSAELRQAYLDLEQGWLSLAPKGAADRIASADERTAGDGQAASSPAGSRQ
jgi:hypothetical protein